MECKYIYGIIKSQEEISSSIANTEDVYTLPYKDIYAVVSDTKFVDLTSLPKDKVVRYLLRHQQVLEGFMDSHTVIPVRLGTYAFSTEEVEEILSMGYRSFKNVMEKVNGRIEINVAATWKDINLVIKDIASLREIKELKDKLMSKPEGISEKDQIMVGRHIKNFLDIRREKLRCEMEDTLRKIVIESAQHALMDDRMIINTACLLDKDKKDEFENAIDGLDKGYKGNIDFRCVGPLPPYSFYTAEIKRIPLADIQKAKKSLGIRGLITEDKLKETYKRLALITHPDRAGGEGFNEINNAYSLLREYITHVREESLRKTQDSIIVKVGYGG